MSDRFQIHEDRSVLRPSEQRTRDHVRVVTARRDERFRPIPDDERFVTDWWEPETGRAGR